MADGNAALVEAGRAEHAIAGISHLVDFVHTFVTVDNINELIDSLGLPPQILSIDVDGNDYWLWEATAIRPEIAILEYNASCGPYRSCSVPYRADFTWSRTGDAEYFHGASLSALAALGSSRGYELVYCERAGANAFFLREDLVPAGWKPSAVADLWRPHAFRSRFESAEAQEAACRRMPFVDV